MALLSTGQLDQLRARAEESMMDTCYLISRINTESSGGRPSLTESTSSGIACRVAVSRQIAREQVVGGAVASVQEFVITLPFGTDTDNLQSVRHSETGRTFEITGRDIHTFPTAVRLTATELT